MEEAFSLKDFEKSYLVQSLPWISVDWVTWQVFEREVKTLLYIEYNISIINMST